MTSTFRSRAAIVFAGVTAAVTLVAAGVAIAGVSAPTTYSGGALLQTKVANNAIGYSVTAVNSWEDLHGSQIKVSVPSGQNRLIVATFNAETQCTMIGKAWCAARIMAKKSGGGTQQLHPTAGNDFALDSGNGELWEGNTMVRSRTLGAGTWTIWVELQKNSDETFFVDDWHFQVDVHR